MSRRLVAKADNSFGCAVAHVAKVVTQVIDDEWGAPTSHMYGPAGPDAGVAEAQRAVAALVEEALACGLVKWVDE